MGLRVGIKAGVVSCFKLSLPCHGGRNVKKVPRIGGEGKKRQELMFSSFSPSIIPFYITEIMACMDARIIFLVRFPRFLQLLCLVSCLRFSFFLFLFFLVKFKETRIMLLFLFFFQMHSDQFNRKTYIG